MLEDIFGQGLGIFYIISQIFALASFIFDLVAAQQKKKASLLNMDTVAASSSLLHYAFLGAWAGMANKIITVVRNALAAYLASKKRKAPKFLPFIFVGAYIIFGIFTFTSVYSLLPTIASSIYSIVIYTTKDANKIRYTIVATSTIWLVYNIFVFSIAGIITQAILLVNDLIAIWRYRKNNIKKTMKRK
jgi:hypothetical protein